MKKLTAVLGSGLFSILMGGALAGSASADVSGPGFAFKAVYYPDCVQIYSSGLKNICSYNVLVMATLPITATGFHQTSVRLYGAKASSCQVVVADENGQNLLVMPRVWGTEYPPTWQTLQTGLPHVWPSTPLVFTCVLEPNGIIGSFRAQ